VGRGLEFEPHALRWCIYFAALQVRSAMGPTCQSRDPPVRLCPPLKPTLQVRSSMGPSRQSWDPPVRLCPPVEPTRQAMGSACQVMFARGTDPVSGWTRLPGQVSQWDSSVSVWDPSIRSGQLWDLLVSLLDLPVGHGCEAEMC
jgi:hypothetical protein